MSRIGKKVITLSKGVTLTVTPANEVVVKGPKGELRQNIDRDIKIRVEGDQV
jgi:large subunit ribosomal protein L6